MAPIEDPIESSTEKRFPKDEKANDSGGDVVMEDSKDGRF